jgi:3'-phosphoadenosine 5'-phosphosulfate sulfotransferase (PAPS reductase)/FAD synthetase
MADNKITSYQLKIRQSLDLELKVMLTERRIRQWYEHWHGQVYVSFSGGKDSTVLLDLVRRQYPEVPAVFINTGQEYAEIIRFVKSADNVIWLKPKMTFWEVVEKYGWPVISKVISMGISRYRNTKSELQKELRLHGGVNPTSGKKQARSIPIKYHYLVNAPFKISERCCDVLKKEPLKRYSKESGRKAFIGLMADESRMRQGEYLKTGCNAYDAGCPASKPMMFWNEVDIWQYIKENNLDYSDIYDKGEERTGCKYCMFGIKAEKEPNRFQRMAKRTPGQFENFGRHGGCDVLDALKVNHKEQRFLFTS